VEYYIENILHQEQIDLLASLTGKKIKEVLVLEHGEFCLESMIITENDVIQIKNLPAVRADRDEYPQFQITKKVYPIVDIGKFKRISVEQTANSVFLTSDKSYWEFKENTWIVRGDIAIEVMLNKGKMAFVLFDSLAGFLKTLFFDDPEKQLSLEDFYIMKSDSPDIIREKIIID
jgi:hypothetical protein